MMGGASDIRQRLSNVVRFVLTHTWLTGVGPTLCSLLWATLCWSCVGVLGWGTCWKLLSGRIHVWHGLVREAVPPGRIVSSDNFDRNRVITHLCFSAIMFFNVNTTLLVNSCRGSFVDRNGTWQCWGRALPNMIFDMLVSWGQSNGCIGNDPPMDRGTTRLCSGFPTTLVCRGICR